MAGFTTTNDSWEFSFDSTPEVPDLPVHDPIDPQGPKVASYLEGPGKWENYSDDKLYEVESLVRKFFESKETDEQWIKDKRGYWKRYTCGMMFEQIYGRKFSNNSNHDDQLRMRRLVKVMTYYSTKIQKEGSIRGKKVTKKIYTLSPKLYKTRPPYCLKLRLQWLAEKGELPCWQNMKLPKDYLKAGQARNPKTNENMRKRREKARELYNKRYADRAR